MKFTHTFIIKKETGFAVSRLFCKAGSPRCRRAGEEDIQMQCAVIDIGSNSMRLTVYEAEPSHFTILFKEKIMAGLAGKNGGAL